MNQNYSISSKKKWSVFTAEQKSQIMSERRKKGWDNKSIDEKKEVGKVLALRRKNKKNAVS